MLKAPGHSFLPPMRYSSLYNIYPSNTHETSFCCHIVVDGSTTMTATPRSVDDAMLLADDTMLPNETLVPLCAHSVMTATTTLLLGGDDNIIGEITTPFGSRLVASMPGLATTPRPLLMTPCRRSLTTSRATTTPRLAMTQCSSTTGFDLLSEKIRAVRQASNPGIFLSDSDNLEQIAVNAATAIGRKVKSLFTKGLGKRKIVEVDQALLSAFSTAATQRCSSPPTSTTPTSTSAKQHNAGATVPPATHVATTTLRTVLFSDAESMLIDQDIFPQHLPHRTSVLQPVYKQLPPEDIVRLKANDELIVVIPAITNTSDKDVLLVL